MGSELSQAPSLADVSLSDDHVQGVDIFSVRPFPIHQIFVERAPPSSLLTHLHEFACCPLPSPSSLRKDLRESLSGITMAVFHSAKPSSVDSATSLSQLFHFSCAFYPPHVPGVIRIRCRFLASHSVSWLQVWLLLLY